MEKKLSLSKDVWTSWTGWMLVMSTHLKRPGAQTLGNCEVWSGKASIVSTGKLLLGYKSFCCPVIASDRMVWHNKMLIQIHSATKEINDCFHRYSSIVNIGCHSAVYVICHGTMIGNRQKYFLSSNLSNVLAWLSIYCGEWVPISLKNSEIPNECHKLQENVKILGKVLVQVEKLLQETLKLFSFKDRTSFPITKSCWTGKI